MSTIRVDNFGPSAGGTTYSARGIAKAWVNFNGTGTIATRDSENVSSLTDNGTGDYTVNFSNAFAAADYSFAGATKPPSGFSNQTFGRVLSGKYNVSPTVSALRIVTCTTSIGLEDFDVNCVTTHGDLA